MKILVYNIINIIVFLEIYFLSNLDENVGWSYSEVLNNYKVIFVLLEYGFIGFVVNIGEFNEDFGYYENFS